MLIVYCLIETLEERIKRYSVAYKEPGVAAHFKSVAEKYNLGNGLKGYVSKADMTEKACRIRAKHAADAYVHIQESMLYLQRETGIDSFGCFGFPFSRPKDDSFSYDQLLGTSMI